MKTIKKNTKAFLIFGAFLINIFLVAASCSNANRDDNTGNRAIENTSNGAIENSTTMDSAAIHQNTIGGASHHSYSDSVQK